MTATATTWIGKLHQRFLKGESLRAQLVRGGLGSLALKVANTGLGFTVAVLLARLLGPDGYGLYAYVFALITLLTLPIQFGLPNLIVREVAVTWVQSDWGLMRGVLRRANQAVAALALAVTTLGGGLAWLFAGHFTDAQLATFAWGLLLAPLLVFARLRGAALRGLHKVIQGQLPELTLRPGLFALLLVGMWLLLPIGALTPPNAMALHVLAGALALGIGAWLLGRARPTEMTAVLPDYRTRNWAMSLMPLGLTAAMMQMSKHTDILLLGFFEPAKEVGIYRVAVQTATLVIFGLQAVNMVIAPNIARLYQTGEQTRLQRMVTWSARAVFLAALPVALAFIVAGSSFLKLVFGSAYATGATALAILCLGQLVNAGMGPVGHILNMSGNERDTARGVTIALAVNLVLNLSLIPPFGIEGAAIATAVTLIIWNGLLWHSVHTRLGLQSGAITLS